LPFKGDTPMEMAQSRVRDEPTPLKMVRDDLPPWLGQVLDICLARDPARRFQTALLFREALRRGLANLPIETPGPAPTPPELIATAAPRSMPILEASSDPVAIAIPRSTPPPAADMPTVATSRSMAADPASSAAPRGRGPVVAVALAAAALIVLVVAGGAFFKMRGSSPSAAAETPVSATTPAPPPEPVANAATAPPPSSPAQSLSPTVNATPLAGGTTASAPVVGAVATPKPALPATDGRTGSGAPTSPSPAAVPGAKPDAARGRGRGAAISAATETSATFSDLRAFVVNGKKAEEQDAILRFQGGVVTLASDKGGRVFAALPYREVTSAAFVRAKNPRWYPTLASPPSGVDMPGGLFRSARAWLALQSRDVYLIVRLNDEDVRRVLDAVTEHTGLKIEQLAPQ
jgi:hypothetical protein